VRKTVPIDLKASFKQEADDSFTVVVEISGIPTADAASRVSEWVRRAIRESSPLLGELDTRQKVY
jgi:hypothetical protein